MKNKTNKIYDERLISESNRIYKKCYFIFCVFILLDLIIKFNMSDLMVKDSKYLWILFGLESIFLIFLYYLNLFSHANKGILIGSSDLPNETFPYKRYVTISTLIAFTISFGLWGIRLIIYSILGLAGDMSLGTKVILMSILIFISFSILFIIIFASYLIAYKVVKMRNQKFVD